MQNSVTLLIGRGKTGTTGIRKFLSCSRDLLARHGIHYVRTGDEVAGIGHQEFAKSFIPRMPDWMETSPRIARIQDDVSLELSHAPIRHFLFSSENFTLADPSAVKSYFEPILGSARFRIIFFARSQDELAESQYNQDVKWSGEAADFAAYITSNRLEEMEFDVLLAPWSRAFGAGNIVARIYDAASPSVIPAFLGSLSLPPEGWAAESGSGSPNKSVGYITAETLRLLNRFGLHRQRELYSKIDSMLSDHDLPALFFSSAEAREFRARFEESNRRFSQQYLLGKTGVSRSR